jgi:hypothetical protein
MQNPFTATVAGLARFYVAGGRYNITATSGSTSVTFSDVLIGSASGADTGTAAGNVPTVAIGDTIWQRILLNNYGAVLAPTSTDDSAAGYAPGSIWVFTDTGVSPPETITYLCTDATEGSAEWISVNVTLDDLGGMAFQSPSAVAISGGTIAGITDLAIADGGTGASSAETARSNLGLGTAATQASTAFATAAQGTLAGTAVQPGANISVLVNDAGYLVASPSPVTVTGNDTPLLTWRARPVFVTAAAEIELPLDATTSLPVGFSFDVYRNTAGAVTMVGEAGVTVRSTEGGTTIGITDQYGWCSVMKVGSNEWSIVGQIEDATP